ncbi:MAG: hypothetical protein FJW35_15270, partial [Acidobacteria bacterium]|nr:hypothetical protein [Acidobacteriota bacterium]
MGNHPYSQGEVSRLPRNLPGLVKELGVLALAALLLLVFQSPAFAQSGAVLTVGSTSGLPASEADLTVSLSPGSASVASLQFDLQLPAGFAYVSTATGAAAGAAGKTATGSPIDGGVRVIVYALNQTVIGSGAVAIVRLAIAPNAPMGTFPVNISGPTASDPAGYSVPISGVNGSVTVLAPPDTTPPVISGVASMNITSSGATIAWTTNEPSDTQVDYGT